MEELPQSQQAKPMTAQMYRYLEMMEEAFRLLVTAYRTGDEEAAEQANKKMREAQRLIEEMRKSKGP